MEALFGGSFDPVHVGHLVVAEAVGEALQLAVRFLPAREQPFKRAVHHAAPEQRAWMLGLAVAGNPRFRVERIELDLPAPSYTVRTLRALAEREPGNRFALLLGADAARDLSSWLEVEALLSGPEGVGKRQFALTFAKAANCQRLPVSEGASHRSDSCDECAVCRRIDAGTYGYTGDSHARSFFRGTAAHSTVMVDNPRPISRRGDADARHLPLPIPQLESDLAEANFHGLPEFVHVLLNP